MAITITPAPMPIAFTLANASKTDATDQASTDSVMHTTASESESESSQQVNQDPRLEEEALRILARSKRRKLDDIPARERWRCPNESCGREYKRTSTTSIGHHRETCPHRPILRARALLQVNPQQLAAQNFSRLQSVYGNQLITSQRLQLLHHAQQLNMQSMNNFPSGQPTTTTTDVPTQQLSHVQTNRMMLNMPSIVSPNENTLYSSLQLPLQSSMLSLPSLNYLPMSNPFNSVSVSHSNNSAFTPVFSNASHSLPTLALNSTMELNKQSNGSSISFHNQAGGISTFAIPTQASITSAPMDVSSQTSTSSQPSSTSVTLVKPIARRRVDHIPPIPISSSKSIVTTPQESPRSLYFTGSAFSFPLQKLPANPLGEKQ
jgi:hypothetical protein